MSPGIPASASRPAGYRIVNILDVPLNVATKARRRKRADQRVPTRGHPRVDSGNRRLENPRGGYASAAALRHLRDGDSTWRRKPRLLRGPMADQCRIRHQAHAMQQRDGDTCRWRGASGHARPFPDINLRAGRHKMRGCLLSRDVPQDPPLSQPGCWTPRHRCRYSP